MSNDNSKALGFLKLKYSNVSSKPSIMVPKKHFSEAAFNSFQEEVKVSL